MEHVIPEVSASLRQAVEDLVVAKRALSDREPKPAWFGMWKDTIDGDIFVDGSMGGDYACWPELTLSTVLPFFDRREALAAPPRPARVPVKAVMGSSYKWSETSLPARCRTVEEAIELFTREACAEPGGLGADVCLIRPLGIFYVSCEGKNRVAFLARNGVDLMPCRLTERDYPAPNRLTLVPVREGPLGSWICVLDSEHAVTVPYPEFTLPLLDAYGVKRGKWSAEWPMPATVMNTFRRQTGDRGKALRQGPTKPVDLSMLKAREGQVRHPPLERAQALLWHDRIARQPRYLLWLALFFCAFIGVGLLLNLFEAWSSEARQAACLGFGGLIGTLGAVCVPVSVRTPDRSADEVASLAADA